MDITKGVTPRDKMLEITGQNSRISRRRKRNRLFFVRKNHTTHTQEHSWDSTVARLEPATPISIVKIKRGSSTMFSTAPSSTLLIAIME